MHEVHCRRNIVLCKKCHEPYPKSELDDHIEEDHSEVACDKCLKKFERAKLENHKENDCPKRMMKCVYCEIEKARDELDEHLEFCGTRTEQCYKCQRFIMIKDQQRHDDSDCSYPEQKPNLIQNGASNHPAGPGRLNSFVFNELTRMVDIPRIQNNLDEMSIDSDDVELPPPHRPIATRRPAQANNRPTAVKNTSLVTKKVGNVSKNTNATTRRTEVSKNIRSSSSVTQKNQSAVNRQTALPTTSKTSNTSTTGNTTSTKTGVNNHNNYSDAGASSSDLDRLMEMPGNFMTDEVYAQLVAQFPDDFMEDDDPIIAPQYSPESGAAPGVSFAQSYMYQQEKTMLPCEFCEASFPQDELVLHQTGCNPIVNTYQKYPSDDESPIFDEAEYDLSTPSNSGEPNIIDNLGSGSQDWVSRPILQDFTDGEETMLPCEFCDNLFPLDFLVQHQAVCDLNRTQTPLPRQRPTHFNIDSSPVLTRPRRHQHDVEDLSIDSDSDDSPLTTNDSRNSYMRGFGINDHTTGQNVAKNSSRYGTGTSSTQGVRKTSDSGLNRGSNARAKRTLDDLVNNPVPLQPKNYLSNSTIEGRRERSTAFRPSKDTSTAGNPTRRTATNIGNSSRGTAFSRNEDPELAGYQASFAKPKSEASKRGMKPVPKTNVGSNLGYLNGMRVPGERSSRPVGKGMSSTQNKKTDASKR
ncbi:TRAF-type zinc finger domain-containing protein 1-like isoform X2 [Lineus longissimus]